MSATTAANSLLHWKTRCARAALFQAHPHQPFYRELGYHPGSLPITNRLKSTLALPFFGGPEQRQVHYVCEQLRTVLNHMSVRIAGRLTKSDAATLSCPMTCVIF